MHIGIPKEIKNNENKVVMSPSGVVTLKSAGHEVYIETGPGLGSTLKQASELQVMMIQPLQNMGLFIIQ